MMETSLFRFHFRTYRTLESILGSRGRAIFEWISFINAITLLVLLICMHVQFVGKANCLPSLLEANQVGPVGIAEVLLIQIEGGWTRAKEEHKREIELILQRSREQSAAHSPSSDPFDKDPTEPPSPPSSINQNVKEPPPSSNNKPKLAQQILRYALGDQLMDDLQQRQNLQESDLEDQRAEGDQEDKEHSLLSVLALEDDLMWFSDPSYLFSIERSFMFLAPHLKEKHFVRQVNVSISSENTCFGGQFQRSLIEELIGYDTIIANDLITMYKGRGYLYNEEYSELYNLNYAGTYNWSQLPIEESILTKLEILVSTLFLFMAVTTLISICHRELHYRVVQFAFELSHVPRTQTSQPVVGRLLLMHISRTIVFVMIIGGVCSIMTDWLQDAFLSALMIGLAWFTEIFSLISVRTPASVGFFPKFYFLYFVMFHLYFFAFPFGFVYIAFMTYASFLQHLMIYFLNHYEIPALQAGTINPQNMRFGRRTPVVVRVQRVMNPAHASAQPVQPMRVVVRQPTGVQPLVRQPAPVSSPQDVVPPGPDVLQRTDPTSDQSDSSESQLRNRRPVENEEE